MKPYSRVPHYIWNLQDLNSPELLLLLALLRFDPCFASYSKLSQMTKMSPRSVKYHMPNLVRKLGIKRWRKGKGYFYDLKKVDGRREPVSEITVQDLHLKGAGFAPVQVQDLPPNKNKEKEKTKKGKRAKSPRGKKAKTSEGLESISEYLSLSRGRFKRALED